jgi:CDP-diacylglycerol--serine O-phosphatidyltransferase
MLKRNLPNLLTLLNLLSGCLGIQQLLASNYLIVPWFIVASGMLDFFDGMLARALRVSSPIGKDLDSLADVISFGALPGFMAFYLIRLTAGCEQPALLNLNEPGPAWLAFLIPLLSAVRLAKFNHDTRQTTSFIGMPTPANGFFWAGLFYGITNDLLPELPAFVLPGIAVLSALILVSELPMFSFKLQGKSSGIQGFIPQIALLIVSVVSLVFWQLAAFAAIVPAYVIISVIVNLAQKPQA